MDLQALLTKGAMKSFDVSIEIGPVRRDHIGDHPNRPEEAHQRGGEIADSKGCQPGGGRCQR